MAAKRLLLTPTNQQIMMLMENFEGRIWRSMPLGLPASDEHLIRNTHYVDVGKGVQARMFRLSTTGHATLRLIKFTELKVDLRKLILAYLDRPCWPISVVGETLHFESEEAHVLSKLGAGNLSHLHLSSEVPCPQKSLPSDLLREAIDETLSVAQLRDWKLVQPLLRQLR